MTNEVKQLLLKPSGTLTKEELEKVIAIPNKERTKFQLANGFKAYKAKEGREVFIIIAKDKNDAENQAVMWNAVVIGVAKNYQP